MRKNIKKLAAVGLTAVLGAGLLAGCGGDGKSSGGKTEITFGIWDENQRPAMEQMVEAYEKEKNRSTGMCSNSSASGRFGFLVCPNKAG
mgnify:CR=1 FL=1